MSRPCVQCRYRKVRCDRRHDVCGNCDRLQFDCSFRASTQRTPSSTSTSSMSTSTGTGTGTNTRDTPVSNTPSFPPERRRGSRACLACRRSKARCSGELPACRTCHQRQRECHYPAAEASSSLLPIRHEELTATLDRFFCYLYPMPPFAFLHEPSIRQQCRDGKLELPLALSIAAVANSFLDSDLRLLQESKSWILTAETFLWEHIHEPSLSRVQALILVVHHHIHTGGFSRAYMLAGLAARAAIALRLNYERPELSFVAQETRRRVLWALTMLDGHFSVGLPEYETVPYAIVYQRFPSLELDYSGDESGGSRQPNLLAAILQLSKVQRDVMRLTRQLAISDKPPAELPGLVQEIQSDLWRIHSDLELNFDYSISSTVQALDMKESRWFPRYLLASLSWHQVHCDLYRIFLPGYAEAVPESIMSATDAAFREHAIKMCATHVQQIFKILQGVLDNVDLPLLPFYVAVTAYQAARLGLFLGSFPGAGAHMVESSAVAGANTAFSLLLHFFSSLPCAQDMIPDLQQLMGGDCSDDAHRHGRLAVHSLIRQANFVDAGYDS
ncbi:hypothetical protein BJY01DRAFT_239340 [Aspergillus pseudoustus]|uniref:Zn(2)-C6 fungal-type domain-containing protein n=1 Tax=Aspergillus pseudoustus TaxID=1810923 RepID=A0ABR4J1T0_9EURO